MKAIALRFHGPRCGTLPVTEDFTISLPSELVFNPQGNPWAPNAAAEGAEQDSWLCTRQLLTCCQDLLDCSWLFKILECLSSSVCLENM